MKIVTVPHSSLRKKAAPIKKIDKKMLQLFADLQKTLMNKKNPGGVGLAGPQVDKNYRLFATFLPTGKIPRPQIRLFINPKIIDHDKQLSFGPDPNDPTLEGCLSIPHLYGPVPRWPRIKLEFDQLVGTELQRVQETFNDFFARVIQHELDHLNGILFTDYLLKYDLPLYQESGRQFLEIDKTVVAAF